MSILLDALTFMNAFPEAVMLIDRKGRFIGANAIFYERTGIANDIFQGALFFKLPFLTKNIERGLVRLFVKISRGEEDHVYSFPYVWDDGTVVHIAVSARKTMLDFGECFLFAFVPSRTKGGILERSDSWKYCMALSHEPYLEFHVANPVPPVDSQSDRHRFLLMLGESLRVKFLNDAAAKFYGDDSKNIEGKTFLSFFSKESDAIGFLDMLSAVGHINYETNVNTAKSAGVHVEMNCMAKFDDDGGMLVLYSSHHDLSDMERYKAMIGSSRQEAYFMFNQPFTGFAFLVPPHPLKRPSLENLDAKLDEMLDQITVVRANQAMFDIYDIDKTKFLIKPMRWFFNDGKVARQVLKELFVMRETSAGQRNPQGDDFELVSVFQAMFDNSDSLNGVLLITSKYSSGYQPRHASQTHQTHQIHQNQEKISAPEEKKAQGRLPKYVSRHAYDPSDPLLNL